MIWLTYQVFMEKYGVENFNPFECLRGVNALLFSQLCVYHYAKVSKDHNVGLGSIYHQTTNDIQSNPTKSGSLG